MSGILLQLIDGTVLTPIVTPISTPIGLLLTALTAPITTPLNQISLLLTQAIANKNNGRSYESDPSPLAWESFEKVSNFISTQTNYINLFKLFIIIFII